MNSLLRQLLRSPLCILKIGSPTVDDDIAWLYKWLEFFNKRIYRPACLDHKHDNSWPFECVNQILQFICGNNSSPLGSFFHEFLGARCCPVINGHAKSVIFHVENKVLAHHGKTDQANVTFRHDCLLRSALHFIEVNWMCRAQ